LDSCTLYLDASGDSGWPPPFGKSSNKWYTMAGIILTPEQDLLTKKRTGEILEKYISDEIKSSYPHNYYELHYLELMCGNNIYKELEKIQRKEMADEVFNFLLELKPIIIATSINKLQMKKVHSTSAFNPKRLAMRSVVSKFSMYLNRHDMIGAVVFDEEEYRNDTKLREMIQNFRTSGTNISGFRYQPSQNTKLENVLNTIQLCPSELSPGLQCTDFIARSVWQHKEKGKSNRYNEIDSLWEHTETSTYKDSVYPSLYKWK